MRAQAIILTKDTRRDYHGGTRVIFTVVPKVVFVAANPADPLDKLAGGIRNAHIMENYLHTRLSTFGFNSMRRVANSYRPLGLVDFLSASINIASGRDPAVRYAAFVCQCLYVFGKC